jgi:hypothetical protein
MEKKVKTTLLIGLAIVCLISAIAIFVEMPEIIPETNNTGLVAGTVPVTAPADLTRDLDAQNISVMTLSDALRAVSFNGSVMAWQSAHKGWGLSQAYTDHMDGKGNSSEWFVTYISGDGILSACIENGMVDSVTTIATNRSVQVLEKDSPMVDSDIIVSDFVAYNNLNIPAGSYPLGFYYDTGMPHGKYKVTCNAGGNLTSMSYDANTGARADISGGDSP